ncbi:MAG: energy-coupling factor transporter transmembrane protein EcfT [Oscillospiraceae bacterium]|jgi:energy-coupling factor transport system permease protein|nr:energy-coupling factor transporter transmembrane protein EcfT [Oscillospiraceae bacterium]
MLRDITLGQFFPGDTLIHRLDPRTKLIMTIVYIAALFLAKSRASYALMAVLLVGMIALSGISPRTIVKSLRPIAVVIALTAVLNMFFTRGEIIAQFWIFKLTREGAAQAVKMAARLIMLIMGTFLLTYTTSPIALTDGLEALLSPLKKIRFPVHELAMMMSIALRFVPTLIEETDKIMSAQASRGADFETGGLIKRARALLPILVPLFISAFRRADELAEAMESRCYNGGEGRTRMKKLEMKRRDLAAMLAGAATIAAVILGNLLP